MVPLIWGNSHLKFWRFRVSLQAGYNRTCNQTITILGDLGACKSAINTLGYRYSEPPRSPGALG